MPELPEVETTCCGIAPHVEGACVQEVKVRNAKLRWPVTRGLNAKLSGETLLRVSRRAKYILLHFEQGYIVIHLGMSGSLRVMDSAETAEKHDHVDICFASGKCLRLNDPRRFGAVFWVKGDEQQLQKHKLFNALGPEPLSDEFDGKLLYQRSRNRKSAVKNFIMDGHIVVGVGNIYANEALFMAGISPLRAAGKISAFRYERLTECIKQVLAAAIKQGGTTLRDFVGGDGKPGYFKQELHVYGRAGQACTRCKQTLTEVRIGQRSSVYCKACQR